MKDVPQNVNCHEYCRYRKQCRYCDGKVGLDPDDCAMYAKIEDLMWDARQDAADERAEREREFEEEDDW